MTPDKDQYGTGWLPAGMSFLSGLPEPARRRRVVMMLQVYVDESGGRGNGPGFVMAGLMSSAERWALFSDAWRGTLDESPRLTRFKAQEASKGAAHGGAGEFRGWSQEAIDTKVRRLVEVVDALAPTAIFCAVDLSSFDELLAPRFQSPLNQPYFWPFHSITIASCHHLLDCGHTERFEIFFDQNKHFFKKAKRWYPLVTHVMEAHERAIMPLEPYERDDQETLPLQAADLFAWCLRRASEHGEDGHPFAWLDMPRVKFSPHSKTLFRDDLTALVERMTTTVLAPEKVQEAMKVIENL